MNENFNYADVPKYYLHCQNDQCLRSGECLRFQVALRADKDVPTFFTVNPNYVSNRKECDYFQPDQLTRFALGMKHLFDNLPYSKAIRIKDILYKQFGRNMYYLFLNKGHLISPEDQAVIQEIFRKEEVEEEPVFDTYIDQYNW